MADATTLAAGAASPARPGMNLFERYLTLWVALCIVAGIVLGQAVPGPFHALGAATVAQVNLPVAALIWLMVIPMLLKVDLGALRQVTAHWRGMAATVGVNWLVKPFSMALLAWLFIGHLFRPLLPAGQIDSYIAGLILLAAAPCTAMVFVWSNLVEGEPNFTLSQVALNDSIMIVAFAPIVGLLLGLSSIAVPWNTLLLSVVLYIVVPVIAAQLWRRSLAERGRDSSPGPCPAGARTGLPGVAPADPRAAVRPPGAADRGTAAGHPATRGADPGAGLLQCRACLLAEPAAGGRVVRGRAVRAHRRLELLRTGSGDRHCAVRLPVGRRAGHRRGRPGRGAGHADRGAPDAPQPRLVRNGRRPARGPGFLSRWT